MNITEIIMTVTEIIGVAAFAISGSMIAIERKLDAFGVVLIGCITSVGGGLIRDIIIGRTPPAVFSSVHIILIAAVTSLVTFLAVYFWHNTYKLVHTKAADNIINFFDALGLGVFSIIGTEAARIAGFYSNMLLAVTLGTITGIGGGMLRDIMTNVTPYVLKKHIYAIASITGSVIYYLMDNAGAERLISVTVSILTVLLIRMLASKYRWSMPKINMDNQ